MEKFLTIAVRTVTYLMLAALLGMCIICGHAEFLIDGFLYLIAGWIFFLQRVVPAITWNWRGIVTVGVCLLCVMVGLVFFFGSVAGRIHGAGGEEGKPKRHWLASRTLSIVSLVVVMFFGGILAVEACHQTILLISSPEPKLQGLFSDATTRSSGNLRQFTIASHTYADDNNTLPPGGTFDPQGRMLHGWMTFLLPYFEQHSLFERINRKVAWDDPANELPFRTIVKMYNQPYRGLIEKDEKGRALGHYAANVRVMGGGKPLALKDITDGTANTILFGEAAGNFKPWGHPTNWRDPALGINKTPDGFGVFASRRSTLFAFADGSVRALNENVDPEVLKALSTPAGGETIPDY